MPKKVKSNKKISPPNKPANTFDYFTDSSSTSTDSNTSTDPTTSTSSSHSSHSSESQKDKKRKPDSSSDSCEESKVIHITNEDEYNSIFKTTPERLIIVDFSATWCSPCRAIAPKYDELSIRYSKCVFLHVDIDELDDSAAVQDVSNVPTFKLFKKGRKIAQFTGANISKLEDLICKNT